MSIKFKCPHCNKSFTVKDEDSGKKGRCPCGAILNVPVGIKEVLPCKTKSGIDVIPQALAYPDLADLINESPIEEEVREVIEPPQKKTFPQVPVSEHKKADYRKRTDTNQIKCPRCGSTSVMGVQKGFSGLKALGGAVIAGPIGLLAGLHGSKKVMVQCLSCGSSWTP